MGEKRSEEAPDGRIAATGEWQDEGLIVQIE